MNTCESQISEEYMRTDFLNDPEAIEFLCFRQNQLRIAFQTTVNNLVGGRWIPNYMISTIYKDTKSSYKENSEKLYYTREFIDHRAEIEEDIGPDFKLFLEQYKKGNLNDAYHTLTQNSEESEINDDFDSLRYDDKIRAFNNYLEQRYGIDPIPEDYLLDVDSDIIPEFKKKDRKPPATLYEKIIANIAMIKLYGIYNRNRERLGQKLTRADMPIYKHLLTFDKVLNKKQLTFPQAPYRGLNYGEYFKLENLGPEEQKRYIMSRLRAINFQSPELKDALCAVLQERLNYANTSIIDLENELSVLAQKIPKVRYDYEKPSGYDQDEAVVYSDECLRICVPNAKKLSGPEELKKQLVSEIGRIIDKQYYDTNKNDEKRHQGYYKYISDLYKKYDNGRRNQVESIELSDVEKKLGFVQNVLAFGSTYNDMTEALFAAKCGKQSLASFMYDDGIKSSGFDIDKFIEGANALYDAITKPEMRQEEKEASFIKGADAMISTYASLGTKVLVGQMGFDKSKNIDAFYLLQKSLIKGLAELGEEFKDSRIVKEYMNRALGKILFENFGNAYLAEILKSGKVDSSKINVKDFVTDGEDSKWILPWRICLAALSSNQLTPEIVAKINNYESYMLQSEVINYASKIGISDLTSDVFMSRMNSINRDLGVNLSPRFNEFFSYAGDLDDSERKIKVVADTEVFEQLFNKVEALPENVAYNVDGNGEPQHVTEFVNGFKQLEDDEIIKPIGRSEDSLTDRNE